MSPPSVALLGPRGKTGGLGLRDAAVGLMQSVGAAGAGRERHAQSAVAGGLGLRDAAVGLVQSVGAAGAGRERHAQSAVAGTASAPGQLPALRPTEGASWAKGRRRGLWKAGGFQT